MHCVRLGGGFWVEHTHYHWSIANDTGQCGCIKDHNIGKIDWASAKPFSNVSCRQQVRESFLVERIARVQCNCIAYLRDMYRECTFSIFGPGLSTPYLPICNVLRSHAQSLFV